MINALRKNTHDQWRNLAPEFEIPGWKSMQRHEPVDILFINKMVLSTKK